MSGKIIKSLLLALAMFSAGYLTAVYRVELNNEQDNSSELSTSVEGITENLKQAASEHGNKALVLLREQIDKMISDENSENSSAEEEK